MNIKTEYEPEIGQTEMLFETVDMPITSKTIVMWSNEETKLLMDLYGSFINEVGPDKRFPHKKNMWLEISSHYPCRTAKQCEERFKTVLKRKKNNFKVYISEAGRKAIDLDNNDTIDDSFLNIKRPRIASNNEGFTTNFKNISSVWSANDTRKLMGLFKRLLPEVGPEKRLQNKKEMWMEISTHFSNKSPLQCEQRLKTVLKRKRQMLMNLDKPKIDKAKEISNLYEYDININIENPPNSYDTDSSENNTSLQSIKSPNSTEHKFNTQVSEELNTQSKKELTLHELLLDIAAKREEGKERRHREKMAAINKMNNLLQQLLNNKK